MTILFFAFLNPERPTSLRRVLSAAAGLWLLAAVPGVTAGLLPASRNRTQGDALFQQAGTAFQSGDLAGALKLLEQADALKPDQADAWNLRGVILLKQHAYDQAEAAFGRAVAIDPSLWAAQFNQAEAAFQKKDWARAETRFDRLLAQTNRFKVANNGSWWPTSRSCALC